MHHHVLLGGDALVDEREALLEILLDIFFWSILDRNDFMVGAVQALRKSEADVVGDRKDPCNFTRGNIKRLI